MTGTGLTLIPRTQQAKGKAGIAVVAAVRSDFKYKESDFPMMLSGPPMFKRSFD